MLITNLFHNQSLIAFIRGGAIGVFKEMEIDADWPVKTRFLLTDIIDQR